jgi:hypothetical protein
MIEGHDVDEMSPEAVAKDRWFNPDHSVLTSRVITVTLLLAPIFLLSLTYRAVFHGLSQPEAMDFAQLGRNLLSGNGFTTEILRPLALTATTDPLRQPDLTHGPLFPLLLAVVFGMWGPHDAAAALTSALCYLATIPVLYWLGDRAFNRTIGLTGALLYAANPQFLGYAVSGLPATLVHFLTASLLLTLYLTHTAAENESNSGSSVDWISPEDRQRLRGAARVRWVLVGLLAGALYLTDPLLVVWLPLVIGALILGPRPDRWPRVAWALGALGLVVTPWMIRNGALTGDPVLGLRHLELWMGAGPGYAADYRLDAGLLTTGPASPLALVVKLLTNGQLLLGALSSSTSLWVIAGCLFGCFFPPDEPARRLRNLVLIGIAALALGMSLLHLDVPLLTGAAPVLILFALADLQRLAWASSLTIRPLKRLTLGFGAFLLFPLAAALAAAPPRVSSSHATVARALGRTVGPRDLVLSDQPWLVAWCSDRPALWIPASAPQLAALRSRHPTLRWVFLTPGSHAYAPDLGRLYDTFHAWNENRRQVTEAGKPPPERISVKTYGVSGWMAALAGLTVVPITDVSPPPSVALGILPAFSPAIAHAPQERPAELAEASAPPARSKNAARSPRPGGSP